MRFPFAPFFNFTYLLYVAPAIILGLWAQWRIRSAYSEAQQVPTRICGAQAARYILDSAGLTSVSIEPIGGELTDHYDPKAKVLRLSPGVYQGYDMAAVGVAAHEAGHALQDLVRYAPLAIRNAAVPVANFGSGFGMTLIFLGLLFSKFLFWIGVVLFSGLVVFQIINLPVEFNASSRAKQQLAALGIVPRNEQVYVERVLNAAAWTYVAATLQSVLTLLYYAIQFGSSRDDR